MLEKHTISVIGLGYVGLPLAVELAKKYPVLGFDIDTRRIEELRRHKDRTLEVESDDLAKADALEFTDNLAHLSGANIHIVTVPTPIDTHKQPDLRPLLSATHTVGKVLKKGDIVVYESTVYPGCTEEDCVPILESESGLVYNQDFFCGYSPERINPGDKVHTLSKIRKVVSGSTPETLATLNEIYSSIITAGTYCASSIKVAEASKVIENAQRDLNIAFVNELALIFEKMNIDTIEVLEAAGTKWNFLPFRPGLVGGHCIGVDPYYLTYKAESLGYNPEVILAGRRINDNMGNFIASKVIKLMIHKNCHIKGAKVLIMGITFKENCPDIRNSRVIDLIREFEEFGMLIEVFDPWADPEEVQKEYGISIIQRFGRNGVYDAVVVAVAHEAFKQVDISTCSHENTVVYDVKGLLPLSSIDARL
ncbi:MAG: nucleotide sugar dehydrogenase [Bernardetiaceae bacterium]|nr:nucleotide sugar dehydrogenase [Bernardetiaceae bacterium]